MRIDKFLSNLKYGSRKEVRNLIKNQDVLLNGNVVTDYEIKIDENCDKITVKGLDVYYRDKIILAIYKPVNYLSSNRDGKHPIVFDLIKEPYNRFDLKMAGRLDLDAEGLMILTTSGELVHRLTHPNHHVDKVYEVHLKLPLTMSMANALLAGVVLIDEDGSSYVGKAKSLNYESDMAWITIDEGRFHQVKKMFLKVSNEVIHLRRIQIGKLKLELMVGTYKEVSESEILGGL